MKDQSNEIPCSLRTQTCDLQMWKGTHYKNITKTFLSSWCRSSSHQFFLVNLFFHLIFEDLSMSPEFPISFLVPPTPFQICSLYSLVCLLRTYMNMFINITYWSFSVAQMCLALTSWDWLNYQGLIPGKNWCSLS